jgi:hypothetical protein
MRPPLRPLHKKSYQNTRKALQARRYKSQLHMFDFTPSSL